MLPQGWGGCVLQTSSDTGCRAQQSQEPQKASSLLNKADRGKHLPFPGTLSNLGLPATPLPLTLFAQGRHLIFPTPGHEGVRNNKSKPQISTPPLLCSRPAWITLHEPFSLGRPALSDFLFQLDKLIFQATFELREV